MKLTIKFLLCCLLINLSACNKSESKLNQNDTMVMKDSYLERVEPPNWWIGFKDNSLQLLVNHENIGEYKPEINYQGVSISNVNRARSLNYLFIDLKIDENTKAGKFDIVFKNENDEEKTHTYELKDRIKPSDDYLGFDSSDVIYLITPDRFANGDESNDIVDGLKETKIDRENDYARHGGDIKGITDHLDYILEMGFTSIWPTPLLINDMPRSSYHGYAMTDFYEVDPRFGTLDEYIDLSQKAKEKGIKLIMDQVANHCGLEHWWMKDLPFDDWVNNQKNYEDNIDNWNWESNIGSNHRRTSNQDIYASIKDNEEMTDGWFVSGMPDLNQRNPYMAKYIIQNSLWWIQTLDLGGIRQDTYPYSDKNFMSEWAGTIMNEYPNFSIVGEEWTLNPLLVAYWQIGNNNLDGYESNLKSPMDFPMQRNIVEGLTEEESWDKGLVKMYEGLANDFIYPNPKDIMIFPDNHDMSRIYTQLSEDLTTTKMAVGYILALPRIPQIYYGTEVLISDSANPGDHGLIRTDFPGGWPGDKINGFTGEGLSDDQKDMQSFLKKVLNYRKDSKAIHEGKTIHFAPFEDTYILFRVLKDEIVVVMINKNESPVTIDLKRHAEIGLEGRTLRNIVTDESFVWDDSITFENKGITILTTK